MEKTRTKVAPAKGREAATKRGSQSNPSKRQILNPVNGRSNEILDALNLKAKQVRTRRQFINLADRVEDGPFKFVKRLGHIPLVFREFAFSKRRNKPMIIFDKPNGKVSKAVIESFGKFIMVSK